MRKHLWLWLVILVLGAFSFGCDQGPPTEEGEAGTGEHASTEEAIGHAVTEAVTVDEAGDEPVIEEEAAQYGFIPLKRLPYEELRIPVWDQVKLYGRLYDPGQVAAMDEEDESEGPGQRYPLVVLLHGLNKTWTSWDQLPARLVDDGYAVLALDMRGHGNSVKNARSWRRFEAEDWQRLPEDVIQVLNFFRGNEDYPQVDSSRTGLIGASLGANTAILAGSKADERIKAIVALSPGLDYKGLETTKAIYRYTNALLLIASKNDAYAYESTEILYRLPKGPKTLQLYKNIGHGTDMVEFFPELQKKIVQWLNTPLPPTAIPIPEEFDEGE